MTDINLDNLSFEELERLKGGIDKTIEQKKQLELLELREQIDQLIEQSPFTLEEVLDARKIRKPVPPKYRNPNDPSQTWTGRGRRPRWVEEFLDNDGDMADLEI